MTAEREPRSWGNTGEPRAIHRDRKTRPVLNDIQAGAQAVLAVFSQSVPEIAKANIDLSKTYTNRFVEAANKGM